MRYAPLMLAVCVAVTGVTVAVAADVPSTAPATVPAVPLPAIHTIVTNPAEDCSTQMNIGWHADPGCTDCTLTYTKKSDTTWSHATTLKAEPHPTTLFNGISSKTPAGKDWKEEASLLDYGLTLTHLEPATQYMYRIAAHNGTVTSPVHAFKTAGHTGEFSFVWISDIHTYTPLPGRLINATKVMNAAVANQPVDFIFSTGDIVAWGGSHSFWRKLYANDFLSNYLFAPAIGNHDAMTRTGTTQNDFFRAANHLPPNGYPGQEGVCYWFIYDDVLFLTLNNEAMKTGPDAEQAAKDWASGVITKQKGRYHKIFIAEHYQWFDGRTGKANWYDHWKDFCDEHHVTLALSGNNHIYERSLPLFHDQVVPDGQGTVYMEAPSSDGERGVEAGPITANPDKLAYTWSSHVKSSPNEVKTTGCVLVRVAHDGTTTKLVYLDDDGEPHVADDHVIDTKK